jgi:hypothetical protein
MESHNDSTIVFNINLAVPFMLSDFIYFNTRIWICIENLSDKVPTFCTDKGRNLVIGVKNLFI